MTDNTDRTPDAPRQDVPPPAPHLPSPGAGYPGASPAGGAYPDPTIPVVYPPTGAPGDQQLGNAAPYASGYGAPSAYVGPPSAAAPGPGGLAITALILGIAAFVTAWIPFIGLIVAIAGIVVGIIAVRRRQGRPLSITGLVLSGVGFLIALVMTLIIAVLIPIAVEDSYSSSAGVHSSVQEIPDPS
ncbi:DUF4190 domain-containing protein [Microbacterium sp. NPDC056234]|uniref:DUF4190 domain-containing protein n=1 Tax=Microbacterium sp. NPDC056234 TaxID=3345757 RepID=UPI0035DD4BE7